MSLLQSVVGFALVAGLMTMTPGLDTLLVLRSALRDGRAPAFATALGVATGCLVWGLAAAVGVSAILTASATLYAVLKLAGAAYLVYLGVRMLWSAWRGDVHLDADAPAPSPASAPASFVRGLTTNLLNPKIGVFYVAILPAFLPPGYPPAATGALLALVHGVEVMIWFTGIILLAARARAWLSSRRAQRGLDAVAGAALVGLGGVLALAEQR